MNRMLFAVATIPAVMVGFCIYKLSNIIGCYFGRKKCMYTMFPGYREHTAEERDAYARFIESIFEEIKIPGEEQNGIG